MRISRLVAVAALVGAFCVAATASANAASTTTCTAEGSVKLSPGLSATPAVQNIQIKGTLKGCTGEESAEVTGGSFQIHAKTAEAVSCSALTGGAATTGEALKLKWKPKPAAGSQSQGTASISLIEGAGALSGSITSGPFDEGLVGGSLTQAYTGGPTCGQESEHKGKKKPGKKVDKGTVSGTLTIS
jgi:hypothetical protein